MVLWAMLQLMSSFLSVWAVSAVNAGGLRHNFLSKHIFRSLAQRLFGNGYSEKKCARRFPVIKKQSLARS